MLDIQSAGAPGHTGYGRATVSGNIRLGFYVVHEIVVAHDSTVEVASTAKAGTTFTIRLTRIVQ